MSRDAVLVSTVDSRVEPSDTLAKSAESAMATFASAPPMPKESISCTAPLPAEANPKPMHPVSTHDAQPTAIILAARFDFLLYIALFSPKRQLPFVEQHTTQPPKRLTA